MLSRSFSEHITGMNIFSIFSSFPFFAFPSFLFLIGSVMSLGGALVLGAEPLISESKKHMPILPGLKEPDVLT